MGLVMRITNLQFTYLKKKLNNLNPVEVFSKVSANE